MDADPRKPKRAVKILLAPLILLNKGLDKLLSKALGDSYYDKEETTQDNIMSMVDAGNEYGNLEDESAQMINNVFEFGDLVASDVMTHRKNIVGVDVNSSLDDIVYIALEKGFSRIPVYKENIDAIVGIIIVKDLLCLVGNENKDKLKIEDFLREAVYVPESCMTEVVDLPTPPFPEATAIIFFTPGTSHFSSSGFSDGAAFSPV